MAEVIAEMTWQFTGPVPDVPLSSEIEVSEWRSSDGGENRESSKRPLFVTLPMLKVGTRSRNGLEWDRASALRVVTEINSKRPSGNLGHMPLEKRSTDYKLPVLRWLGAMLDEQTGLVWGKAYVPAYAEDVREFLADAKRARARVGVSVYGMRGEKGLADMTLEDIDLGHPDRVSHPNAAAVPHLTSEMASTDENKGEQPMSDVNLVSELTTARDNALRQVSELTSKSGDLERQVAEMRTKVASLDTLGALVAEFAGGDLAAKIGGLVAEVKAARAKARQAEIDGVVAEMVALEALRPTILAQLGDVPDAAAAKAKIAELLARADIKVIAEALTAKVAGPNAIIAAPGTDSLSALLSKPEFVAAQRNWLGV